jgi:simple sugar transport system substrate-binding protein
MLRGSPIFEGAKRFLKSTVAMLVIVAIIAGAIGYIIGVSLAPAPAPAQVWKPPERIKAAWIYVGPIGDYGWSYMHDIGRKYVQELFKDWLETTYVPSVPEEKLLEVIDNLVAGGYNVIFTTSFEFMDKTIEAAKKYPNVMFFHCSGYKRAPNVGTYFADLYEVYYLNGLIAGALTKTGQIGYVAAYLIPEVVRHINAFAIGAREVGEQLGKNITVHVIEIRSWYSPERAKQAAETLVSVYNVDVLAFTEDSTAVIEYAEEQYNKGKEIYVFSHYGPMLKYGNNTVVSGQLVRWERIYADILVKIKAGIYTPYNLDKVDYWYLLSSGAVDLGADIAPDGSVVMFNPKYIDALKKINVTDKTDGQELSVYDLVLKRYQQMKNAIMVVPLQVSSETHVYENIRNITMSWGGKLGSLPYPLASVFDPFTGPLKAYCIYEPQESSSDICRGASKNAPVEIPAGVRLGHKDLWTMDYFMEWVELHGG